MLKANRLHRRLLTSTILLPLCGISSSWANEAGDRPMAPTAERAGQRLHIKDRSERDIRPGDHLVVVIADVNVEGVESRHPRKVDAAGKIGLPFIGRILASGRTTAQLTADINGAYQRSNVLMQAEIKVEFDRDEWVEANDPDHQQDA